MKRYILGFIIVTLSVFCGMISYYTASHYGYKTLWIVPIIYSLNYIFYFLILQQKVNVIVIIINIVMFIRYIILTYLLITTNIDLSRSMYSPSEDSYRLAVLLMSYEMIVIFLLNYLWISKLNFTAEKFTVKLIENKFVYILFIIFSIILFLLQPSLWDRVSFIIPTDKATLNDNLSTISSITYFALNIARFILIALITSWMYRSYLKKENSKYIFWNYMLVALLCLIIFGNNRADFIIPFLATLFLLQIVYKKKGTLYSIISLLLASIMIFIITQSRQSTSVESNLPFMESLTVTIQSYFGGIFNVATAIEIRYFYDNYINASNFFYDLIRPFLGLNFIVNQSDSILVSHLFNYLMNGREHVSQILPSIGHGYFYFGFFLAPIFSIFLILLGRLMIKIIQKINSIDLILFMLILLMRITISFNQNITIFINELSSILMIFIPIYILNKFIKLK